MTSPLAQYTAKIESGALIADDAQAHAVAELDRLWHELIEKTQSSKGFFSIFKKKTSPKGVYMWGGVGRGKTWLMDQFFDALPLERKMRMHFHHFMQFVHKELNLRAGQQNPLDLVADQIDKQAIVICFDEFFVSNVTDAMILSDLFQKLFSRGITLVATSNIAPEGLYKDGLHRDRFLPTIALLTEHCHILNVDAGVDYRLRTLKQAERYQTPLNDVNTEWMKTYFTALAHHQTVAFDAIEINHRQVATLGHTEDVLWCTFSELCLKPRSPADFIAIANKYQTVLVSDIPVLTDQISDGVRRFIYLVDEFYDRRITLIITSAAPILTLYQGKKLAFEIERTRSRLLEMQSDEYLNG